MSWMEKRVRIQQSLSAQREGTDHDGVFVERILEVPPHLVDLAVLGRDVGDTAVRDGLERSDELVPRVLVRYPNVVVVVLVLVPVRSSIAPEVEVESCAVEVVLDRLDRLEPRVHIPLGWELGKDLLVDQLGVRFERRVVRLEEAQVPRDPRPVDLKLLERRLGRLGVRSSLANDDDVEVLG